MRNTKTQAFTLVELIVVITILAILGTIAFISLQGYSADARNSKRTSDLGNIQSAISLKQVEGVPLLSFVNNSVTDAGITLTDMALAGSGASTAAEYIAGVPAYTVLNVSEKDFKDPQGKEYRIGATSLDGSVFQVAATIEVDGTPTALVNGTYNNRDTTPYEIDTVDGKIATLVDSAANTFKAGDFVTVGGTARVISKVSRDGVTLTFETTGATDIQTVALTTAEEAGLIADKTVATTAVTNDQATNLPY